MGKFKTSEEIEKEIYCQCDSPKPEKEEILGNYLRTDSLALSEWKWVEHYICGICKQWIAFEEAERMVKNE